MASPVSRCRERMALPEALIVLLLANALEWLVVAAERSAWFDVLPMRGDRRIK